MRRENTRTLGEVIGEFKEAYRLDSKLAEVAALKAWKDVVGGNIAKRTKELRISSGILYVKIESSIIKQELMMIRTEIVKRLNKAAGADVISRLVFI